MITARLGAIGSLMVAECFGPTLQGEGPSSGQLAVFVRLSRCNLTCVGCDTPYTWDWSRFDPGAESRRMSVADLVGWVATRPAPLVVITGGEPLLQQDGVAALVAELVSSGRRIEVETNGTRAPSAALLAGVSQFNVSPKLAGFGAGMDRRRRINDAALRAFAASGKAVFKFVVTAPTDLDEIAALERRLGLAPVWVMPEGTTAEAVLSGMSWLAEEAVTRGWNVSTRLHVLLWGDQRGR